MARLLKTGFLIVVLLGLVLGITGCGGQEEAVLRVYNWGDYIDESVLDDFEKEYGIKVIYDNFATNEDMYVKLKSGGGNYDLVFPSDYMIQRMIREDMLAEIDFDNVPNYKYIDPRFKNLSYDPENAYSVPYMWGTLGILYNKTMVQGTVDSWKVLWDPEYAKEIFMLDSQRDSIGITLKMLGYSLNSKDLNELEEAKETLIKQKPLVLAYVGDEVKDKMIAGEAALAVVWSGDAVFTKRENPDLEYVIPKEGSNLWVDAMVIPKNSKHKKEAELFINFMCRPDIALRNAEYIGYSSPHTEVVKMLDPEVKNDKTAYPDDETLARCEVMDDLSDILEVYDRIWTEVKAR